MNVAATTILYKCKKMTFQVRIFTTQLSLADMLFGFQLILVGLRISSLSEINCRMNFHCTSALHFVSFFTITTMSCDRFLALCFPFKYQRTITVRKVKFFSASLWISAAVLSFVMLAWREPHDFNGCNYIEVAGEKGYILFAVLYVVVLILNSSFCVGVMCALLRIKNATGPVNDDRRARYMKDQTRILVKILGILSLFVFTYVPHMVICIILGMDFDNKQKYMFPFILTLFLGMSNSFFSPIVYVWRYPECRYMLMIHCYFWNKEKQDKLREELNQYIATYSIDVTETAITTPWSWMTQWVPGDIQLRYYWHYHYPFTNNSVNSLRHTE